MATALLFQVALSAKAAPSIPLVTLQTAVILLPPLLLASPMESRWSCLWAAQSVPTLSSQQEAETIGQNLWDAYGAGNGTVPRPFGATTVDGWDFDIEASSGNQYYQYLIAKLRSNFNGGNYVITGAPVS